MEFLRGVGILSLERGCFSLNRTTRGQAYGSTHDSRPTRSPKTIRRVRHQAMAQSHVASPYLFLVQAACTGTTRLGSATPLETRKSMTLSEQ